MRSIKLPKSCLLLVLLSAVSIFAPHNLYCQPQTAGQAVVPIGWENEDSIRFAIFNIEGAKDNAYDYPAHVDSLMDEFEVNYEHQFIGFLPLNAQVYGKRKGITTGFTTVADSGLIDLTLLGNTMKQRLFYPSPSPLPMGGSNAPYWRYNDIFIDTSNSHWFNNEYDANDISPYSEYFRKPSFVAQTFITKTSSNIDTTVAVGEAGRVVLGYSDDRIADRLLAVFGQPSWFPVGIHPDTAKAFTARLEFNLNTGTIDTTNLDGRNIDDLPLMRVQIAYKPPGRRTLPFVPFKTVDDSSKPGWYIVIDTLITKAVFDSLNDSWRAKDTLESGGYNNPGRPLKQLQLVLKNLPGQPHRIPQSMQSRIKADTTNVNFVSQSIQGPITIYQHPDSLVGIPGNNVVLDSINPLIEIRILSTYRSTLRVRSIAWQDEVADRYFYRRKFDDTVHSCNMDGSYGGLDDTLYSQFSKRKRMQSVPQKYILYNDMDFCIDGFSSSMIGLIDHIGSKFGYHTHLRDQEFSGARSRQLRRERLSHDGKVLGIYENQFTRFEANAYGYQSDSLPRGMIPHDYVYHVVTPDRSKAWPRGASDSTALTLIVARTDDAALTGDSLLAYKRYTEYLDGMGAWSLSHRGTAYVSKKHPRARRFAVEAEIQGWGGLRPRYNWYGLHPLPGQSTPPAFPGIYAQRPSTPEETVVQFWLGLANGVTSFNMAEAFDLGMRHTGSTGPFHSIWRNAYSDAPRYTSEFNFGHHRHGGRWGYWYPPQTCESDSVPEDYYVGYSNTGRAVKRAVSRINAIYSLGSYPIKRLEWLDSYSANRALNWRADSASRAVDSLSRLNSFLKVTKTETVDQWQRGPNGQYLDLHVIDSAHRTYIESGLFRDNDSASQLPKGYAALIVNTRLWPGRDKVDTAYYNAGLAAKDRMQPTLGDIDVRKVYMKIDPTKMHDSMRSTYYVVRDIWHPDTCWLVHKDSEFAVYIKPGDAKFLYIEKGISIRGFPDLALGRRVVWL